jgi:structural maintenance of chromosome 2
MSGGAAPSGSGVLVRAQELRAAAEHVANVQKTLEALGREEAWRARTRKVEIKEHALRLLREHWSRLKPTMPPGCVVLPLIVLWFFP